jgi:hypothetical protein
VEGGFGGVSWGRKEVQNIELGWLWLVIMRFISRCASKARLMIVDETRVPLAWSINHNLHIISASPSSTASP